jgi:hypothetical protein
MKQLALAILLTVAIATFGQMPAPTHPKCEQCDPMIDGAEHPELIPDSVAYRMWFSLIGHRLDDAKNPDHVHDFMRLIGLDEVDEATLRGIVLTWHQQEKDLVNTYNATVNEASRAGNATYPIQIKFAHDQADLALATAKIAKEQLSPEGAKKFEAYIQGFKGGISMNKGVI